MSDERPREELMELLGAYALDAVDDDERASIDALLDTDPAARAELARFRAATERLAGPEMEPPAGLWDGLAARLDDDRPAARLSSVEAGAVRSPTAAPYPGRPGRKPLLTLAAAAAVVVALVGAAVVLLRDEDPATVAQLAAAARDDGEHEVVDLVVDGEVLAQIVFDDSGVGYFLDEQLTALPDDRTYQLWGVEGDQVISLGVLGSRPSTVAFRSDGPVDAFVLTDERAGGVGQSEGEVVAQVALA